jgi:hypothetical protein
MFPGPASIDPTDATADPDLLIQWLGPDRVALERLLFENLGDGHTRLTTTTWSLAP